MWRTSDGLGLMPARCCQVWPVVFGVPVGRCGICGERPEALDWAETQRWLAERDIPLN